MSYIIEVEDRGIGLDVGIFDPDTMFLPGVRGKNVAQYHNVSGTGVGLSVVKAIVEAHGGTVSFTSPRKPTIVRLCLPAALRHSFQKATSNSKRTRI